MQVTTENSRAAATGTSLLDFKRQLSTKDFPNRFAQYVMEGGKAYYWPTGGFHVVTDAALAKIVLKDPCFSADRSQFFISRMPNMDLRLIGDFFSVVQKMMVMRDGADHASVRRTAALGLEDHILERFSHEVQLSIEQMLDEAFRKRKIEFVGEIARRLPSTVLAGLFSIPPSDREKFFTWSNQMTAFFGGATAYENADGVRVNQAASKLREYFRELFSRRRHHPGDDYATSLVKAQVLYDLTEDEIISQAIMMLVAGSVTTTDQIANCAYQIFSAPLLQSRLRFHPQSLPAALEELKRFDPAVTFLFRVAKDRFLLGGQRIEAGETVFISNHAVNRDPGLERPFEIDIGRPAANHFAYGHGAHYCLGAKLGRQQIQLLFHSLLTRYPKLELDPAGLTTRDHYSLSFSGFGRMDLVR